MRPHGWQPTRLCHPWVSPGKNPGVGCHFLLQCMKVKSESEVAQSCPTLRDPMDCSPPGSSVHGIFQARVLESGGAIAFSKWVHLLAYIKGCDSFLLLQSLCRSPGMFLTFWFKACWITEEFSFSSAFVERIPRMGEDFNFNSSAIWYFLAFYKKNFGV